jgi:uncharacterized membrane protein (UPF0127 family)
MMRSLRPLLLAVALAACAATAQVPSLEELTNFPRGAVEIVARGGKQRFDVWIADTPSRKSQGLMFVTDLPADRGMVFIHEPPRVAGMWMKNTYVELDMLFVAGGVIVKIAPRARPHSLETIPSEVAVDAVIELRGGEAARRGIAVGDRVRIRLPRR